MRSSKKTFSVILSTILLLFALASCNVGNPPAETTQGTPDTTASVTSAPPTETTTDSTESTSEPPEETTAGEPVKADWLPSEAKIDNRGVLLYATFPSSYTKDAPIQGTLTLKNTTGAPLSLSLRIFIGIGEYPDLMGDGSTPTESLSFSDTREAVDSPYTYLPVSLAVGEQITVDFSIPTDQNTFADEVVFYYFTIALYESESAQAPTYAFCFPIKQSYAMSRY